MGEPVSKELLSNSSGVIKIDSSFVAEMPEVREMRKALKGDRNFVFLYEFVQNAIDYHQYNPDDPQDLPSIICILPDGKRILHSELGENDRPVRIEVHNKIRGNAGLDPYAVSNIEHVASSETLGKHGRGGTVAATAALVDHHISGIDYSSKTPEYAWKGRGIMQTLDPRHQKTPRFVVELEHVVEENVSETVIGIDDPDDSVIESLRTLPQNFLSANPQYEGYKIKILEREKIPNLLTVNENQSKVEILADELVGRDSSEEVTQAIYEGGLKLSNRWYSTILNWSFYGLGGDDINWQYRVFRSKDSSHLEGHPKELMSTVLSRCESSEIFARLFKYSMKTSQISAMEEEIDEDTFRNVSAPVQKAIQSAWDQLSKSLNLPEDVLITTDLNLKVKAEQGGKKAVFIKSKAFANAIKKVVGLEDAIKALGIDKAPVRTGEQITYTRGEVSKHLSSAIEDIVGVMSVNEGMLRQDEKGMTIELSGKASNMFLGRYGDLPIGLQSFIKNYLLAGGDCQITANDDLFEFEIRDYGDGRNEVSLMIKRGTAKELGMGKILISFFNNNQDEVFNKFRKLLLKDIGGAMGNGIIDWEQYLASKSPPDLKSLQDIMRQQEERISELERKKEEEKQSPALSSRAHQILTRKNALIAGSAAALFVMGLFGVKQIPSFEAGKQTTSLENTIKLKKNIADSSLENRLPDRISEEELEGILPQVVGEVVNLPQRWFKNTNGEVIGYFPQDQRLNTNDLSIALDPRVISKISEDSAIFTLAFQEERSLEIVARDDSFKKDQLVYLVNAPSQILLPPVGWRMKAVYAGGGDSPRRPLSIGSDLGVFWPDPKDVPKKAMVVAEKIEEQQLDSNISPRIRSYGKISPIGEYEPTFDLKKAMSLNSRLEGDPKLQKIHADFVREMYAWTISGTKDKKEATGIILRNLNNLSFYSNNRYFSLSFQIDKEENGYDTLISVAQHPEDGYFCSVASNLTADFLESVGITASNQPGYNLINVNGSMTTLFAHQNSGVYMPDGGYFTVDNSPFMTDKTEETTRKLFTRRPPADSSVSSSSVAALTSLLQETVNTETGDISSTADKMAVLDMLIKLGFAGSVLLNAYLLLTGRRKEEK